MYQTIIEDFDRRGATRIGGEFSERGHVLLRIGGKDVAATLLDQSSRGFSIELPKSKGRLRAGQRLLVGMRSTWHEVVVVHVQKSKKYTRAGLEVVSDCVETKPNRLAMWSMMGLALVLAVAIIYQNEDPRRGTLHQTWEQLTR